jgi:uncharacterized membrane protein YqaE (UPF0057 family)
LILPKGLYNLAFSIVKTAIGAMILFILQPGIAVLLGMPIYDLQVIFYINIVTTLIGWVFAMIFVRRPKETVQ